MDHDEMHKAVQRALAPEELILEHPHDHGHDHGHLHDHDHPHPHDDSSNVDINVSTIMDWLATKHSTLWSTWAIDDDKGKERAAQWLYQEIESLIRYAMATRALQTTSG